MTEKATGLYKRDYKENSNSTNGAYNIYDQKHGATSRKLMPSARHQALTQLVKDLLRHIFGFRLQQRLPGLNQHHRLVENTYPQDIICIVFTSSFVFTDIICLVFISSFASRT